MMIIVAIIFITIIICILSFSSVWENFQLSWNCSLCIDTNMVTSQILMLSESAYLLYRLGS